MKQIVSTDKAPAAIGPYSQAVISGGFLFTSGQIAINPQSGQIEKTDAEGQARQVLENLKAVLAARNLGLDSVVKTTVFIKNMGDFAGINQVYAEYFKEPYPARSCVEVARLPKDVLVEIEVVAAI
ncbi:MAG: RidA family protein [Clostridia bacterium]|nr:RidA family protein [Clostridia bacterium]